jgi:hypothetical protein
MDAFIVCGVFFLAVIRLLVLVQARQEERRAGAAALT